jgi:hypothetical protein
LFIGAQVDADSYLYPPRELEETAMSSDVSVFVAPIRTIWATGLRLVRQCAMTVAWPLHQGLPFPSAAFRDVLDRFDTLHAWHKASIAHLRCCAPSIFVPRQRAVLNIDVLSQFEGASMVLTAVPLLLRSNLDVYKARQQKSRIVALADEFANQQQIEDLRTKCLQTCRIAARHIAANVALRPITEALYYNSTIGYVGGMLNQFAEILIDAPTAEEGGPPDFPRQDKFREAQLWVGPSRSGLCS